LIVDRSRIRLRRIWNRTRTHTRPRDRFDNTQHSRNNNSTLYVIIYRVVHETRNWKIYVMQRTRNFGGEEGVYTIQAGHVAACTKYEPNAQQTHIWNFQYAGEGFMAYIIHNTIICIIRIQHYRIISCTRAVACCF